MSESLICPICGYNFEVTHNYSRDAQGLLDRRSNAVKVVISSILRLMKEWQPSQANHYTYYRFLQLISKAGNRAVLRMTDEYLYKQYYMKGYGLAYLAAMINNCDKDSVKRIEAERRQLGSIPPYK